MLLPRFRLFAGPNGSGKTYLFNYLKSKKIIHTEIYVNADKIEAQIKKDLSFNFNAYRVKVSAIDFKKHVLDSSLFSKMEDQSFINNFTLQSGILLLNLKRDSINSYHASLIATYLAHKLIETKQSFCFETVMSHVSKIDLIDIAKKNNYKTYLYFVFTENIEVNILRVKYRVALGLHNVKESVIRSRLPKTLKNLPLAFNKCDEAFVIDNSDLPKIVIKKQLGIVTKIENIPLIIKPFLKNIY